MSIFQTITPFIEGNKSLLQPQLEAYRAAKSFYEEFTQPDYKETLIIMPTGSGKTGLMSILPFKLSSGRVLIITPGKIIRKTVFKELDSISNPEETFWYKHNIVLDKKSLPKSYLYKGWNSKDKSDKARTIQKLQASDIVITNVHKITGSSEEQALINLIERNFFDMIIIDEAHHVAADMWQKTLEYFNVKKVIKLTATPVRADNLDVSNNPYDPIYRYSLGQSIKDGLVKDIIKKEEIPERLEFEDPQTGRVYTPAQARMLLGDEWVNESLIMSETCSKTIIRHTLKVLKEKRKSYPKHQVLAVACHQKHAQLLTKWFQEEGAKATYVSSYLSDRENEERINDFANNLYDVMINIQMLGEGFDNPNISVISMFRPFKSISLYAQVIGRGIRLIRDSKATLSDNYCDVIYHKELNLEELWRMYKEEKTYADIKRKNSKQLTLFDYFELGAVEMNPSLNNNLNKKEDVEEMRGRVMHIGDIKTYKSKGLGNEDSFSSDGLNKYRKSATEIAAATELAEYEKLNAERVKYKKLVDEGHIDLETYELIINQKEEKAQNEISVYFNELKDLITAEQLRWDFNTWLNDKITEFFSKSTLNEEGYELWEESGLYGGKKVNNLGYIVRNIRQSLFDKSKKRITSFNAIDFAKAKEVVNAKISFYLKEYPPTKN